MQSIMASGASEALPPDCPPVDPTQRLAADADKVKQLFERMSMMDRQGGHGPPRLPPAPKASPQAAGAAASSRRPSGGTSLPEARGPWNPGSAKPPPRPSHGGSTSPLGKQHPPGSSRVRRTSDLLRSAASRKSKAASIISESTENSSAFEEGREGIWDDGETWATSALQRQDDGALEPEPQLLEFVDGIVYRALDIPSDVTASASGGGSRRTSSVDGQTNQTRRLLFTPRRHLQSQVPEPSPRTAVAPAYGGLPRPAPPGRAAERGGADRPLGSAGPILPSGYHDKLRRTSAGPAREPAASEPWRGAGSSRAGAAACQEVHPGTYATPRKTQATPIVGRSGSDCLEYFGYFCFYIC